MINDKMVLNDHGRIAEKYWLEIPKHFPDVLLDEFVIMPNHIHGIIVMCNEDAGRADSDPPLRSAVKSVYSLSSIIRGFKIGVTKYFREHNNEHFAWQRSFYDHIIRNETSLQKIREYIRDNPARWSVDREKEEENLFFALQQ